MKTFQRVKLQYEIVQYIKRVQHKKNVTWKDYYTKKCNMEMVQYEKNAKWKNIYCHSEIRKKCTRIVRYSAQTDIRLSIDVLLYAGFM